MANDEEHDPMDTEEKYDTLYLVEDMKTGQRRTRFLVVGIMVIIVVILAVAIIIGPASVDDAENRAVETGVQGSK